MKSNRLAELSKEDWDFISDIEIPLTFELGRTHLLLKDVMNLTKNSVVKLNRSTGEGLLVRSGDHTLFRAEVMVIEDRAGIRINEIYEENKQ